MGADDVLVKIHAAGVNPLDMKIRNGDLKAILPYRLPLVLGNDLAGTVVRVGSSVDRFAVGDEVYARPDKAFQTQLKAIKKWGRSTPDDLSQLTQPT